MKILRAIRKFFNLMVLTFYRVDGKIRDFEEMELFELVDIADKLFELVDIKFFFVKIFD